MKHKEVVFHTFLLHKNDNPTKVIRLIKEKKISTIHTIDLLYFLFFSYLSEITNLIFSIGWLRTTKN